MSAPPPFTIALCEGYHDRSFLAGALVERLGWEEPGLEADGRRKPWQDRWGQVAGGDFGYVHPETRAQIRLRPCGGHTKVPVAVQKVLQGRATRPFDRLLVNYDGDKGGDGPDYLARIHGSVRDLLVRSGAEPEIVSEGRFLIDGGARSVDVMVWRCDGPPREGVPAQQCLERVLCTAAAAVWPDRMASVGRWLRERPEPTTRVSGDAEGAPPTIAKSHGWTLMAGWFADHGCDDFLKQVWRSPMRDALEKLLVESGAWATLDSCRGVETR